MVKHPLHTPYKTVRRKREADGEGFEPPVGFPTSVFKTGALNRSAIHPFSRFQRIPWSNYQSSNGPEGF